jgi:hypothetical protein
MTADGEAVICMRVQSERPKTMKSGATGYLHTMREPVPLPVPRRKPRVATKPARLATIARQAESEATTDDVAALSNELWVSVASLKRLHIGWLDRWLPTTAGGQRRYIGWTFPMRDAHGVVTGIRVRSMTGAKFAVPGSHDGLFIPDGIRYEGSRLWIVEGPTDCAAMLDLGADCIGRSSCQTGGPYLTTWARGREIVIVADNDSAKLRPDGTAFYPGQEGAEALAGLLAPLASRLWVIRPPNHKDVRQWRRAMPRLTLRDLDEMVAMRRPWRMAHGR